MPDKDITAKLQWHPAFVAAMHLELRENRGDLVFHKEYNLNTRPLEIDLLVIKKNADISIGNEIGRLFRGHNILEYKSPEDHLDIDTFYKASAYAALYKSYGDTLDAIKAADVTVSLIRQARPDGLFHDFKEQGIPVSNPYHGIYYVEKKVLFPTQIVVTKELDKASHIWLGALSGKLQRQDITSLLEHTMDLRDKAEKEFADSVLQVSMGANQRIIEKLKGDENMACQALMEIMAPELQRSWEAGWDKCRDESIAVTVKMLRELGQNDKDIEASIIKNFGLSSAEAGRLLNVQAR